MTHVTESFLPVCLLSLDQMTDHLLLGTDSVNRKKRCVFHGPLMSVVISKLCQLYVTTPIVLLIVDVSSLALVQYGIGPFGLSVCLWMASCAECSFHS